MSPENAVVKHFRRLGGGDRNENRCVLGAGAALTDTPGRSSRYVAQGDKWMLACPEGIRLTADSEKSHFRPGARVWADWRTGWK